MVVDISENSDEIASTVGFGEGTVVICSFTPVALSPDLKSRLSSLPKVSCKWMAKIKKI